MRGSRVSLGQDFSILLSVTLFDNAIPINAPVAQPLHS